MPRAVVIGLGKTGLSCARFLVDRGFEVVVMDSRDTPPGLNELRQELPGLALVLGRFDAGQIERADLLIVSPGVSLKTPVLAAAIAAGKQAIGDIELFARYAGAPLVAITGSNGKSTVTTLLGEMAQYAGQRVRVGGNIGTPALELLQGEAPDLYILELSSFQLETTHSLNPAAAVVLNVSQDHLDRYEGMVEYADAKAGIYAGDGVMVINLDDPVVAGMHRSGRRSIGFTLNKPQDEGQFGLLEHDGQLWLARGSERLLPASRLRLAGRHNIANALAALALGTAVGLPMAAMLAVLPEFIGLAHRCQWVAQTHGVTWYNDSKATNVGASVAAIEGMPGGVVLIAGGQAKGQDFAPLKEAVEQHCRAVVLIGEDAAQIQEALADCVPVAQAGNMADAVGQAKRMAEAGDSVLLSPACASFDMFSGFEERGRQFAAAVRRAS
ncbi:MAG TPA: UDP-N-acetylmuramoyl-L-alanine--D-glutamate ligase [Candidatus Tenderia sp.]|nr:UDP-N-acetylmuramoyl-L-alanine--D-glutamate ligase [Candidatus Tenderia sp.]